MGWKHFPNSNHNVQKDAKFTLIKQITETETFTTTEKLRPLLNFWITENTLTRWFEPRT